MATRSTEDLLSRVLRLPLDERARVAREVIVSLADGPPETGASWPNEIARRARDVLAGENVVVETGELFRRLRNELSSARGEAVQATRSSRGRSKKGRKVVRAKGSRSR
jgi:hypothetical protein